MSSFTDLKASHPLGFTHKQCQGRFSYKHIAEIGRPVKDIEFTDFLILLGSLKSRSDQNTAKIVLHFIAISQNSILSAYCIPIANVLKLKDIIHIYTQKPWNVAL